MITETLSMPPFIRRFRKSIIPNGVRIFSVNKDGVWYADHVGSVTLTYNGAEFYSPLLWYREIVGRIGE